MTDGSRQIPDGVPRDAPCNAEIGFAVPDRYNASAILFDNLIAGSHRPAVIGPAGSRTYGELAADAVAFGAGLLSLGLQRGDRVLLFLDDTPAYPAAVFGAIRAGLVPLLINTLTPPDLLQFYLSDSGATVAICDAAFAYRFNAEACRATQLEDRGDRQRRRHGVRPGRNAIRGGVAGAAARTAASRRYPSRRHGVLDVLVRIDRAPEGHRASAARHALHAPVVRAPPAAADAGRHLLLGAEDLLRLRLRQLDHLPLLRRRLQRPAARPAQARRHLRLHRPLSPHGLLRLADPLHRAHQIRGSRRRRPVEPAPRRVGRRGPLGRRVQQLEGHVRPRDHGGARLQRGAAHLPVEHGAGQEAGRGRQARAGLRDPPARTARARRWRTARKASCGCAATPTRPSTGTAPTRPPRPCARPAGSTPATASCATPTASTSSAAAPTIWSRSAANGSTRSRWNSRWPTIHRCANARSPPSKAPTASPC